jgi:hypothetical protein
MFGKRTLPLDFFLSSVPKEMPKPREPEPGECCGTGCARCVWDIYFDKVAEWEQARCATTDALSTLHAADDTPADAVPTVSRIGSVVVKFIEEPSDEAERAAHLDWRPAEHIATGTNTQHGDCKLFSMHRIRAAWGSTGNNRLPAALPGGVLRVFLETAAPSAGSADASKAILSELRCGDIAELYLPNDDALVDRLCQRLLLPPTRWCVLAASPFVPPTNFPPWLPLGMPMTVRHLLKHYVDISSSAPLNGSALYALLQKTIKSSPSTAGRDEELVKLVAAAACDEGGDAVQRQREARLAVVKRHWALPDVLDALCCSPSLARLLEATTPLLSRPFSVVQATHPTASGHGPVFEFCMRHTIMPQVPTPPVGSTHLLGHVSGRLGAAVSSDHAAPQGPWLGCSGTLGWMSWRLFGKGKIPPQVECRPLLLIGGGTGIAPLVSLMRAARTPGLSQRQALWVVHGVRYAHEAIYHEELQTAADRYALAVSRSPVTVTAPSSSSTAPCDSDLGSSPLGGGRRYVTDVLHEWADDVAGFVVGKGATVVSCGPRSMMEALRQRLPMLLFPGSESGAADMQRLEAEGRVVFDTWH